MLCLKSYHKIGFGILFSVLLSVFFSLFCLDTDSFAAPYSFTFDSSAQSRQTLCQLSTPGLSSCDDYSYIRLNSNFSTVGSIRLYYNRDTSSDLDCSSSTSTQFSQSFSWSSDIIFKLPHVCSISFGDSYSWQTSSGSLTITLYDYDIFDDSGSDCPVCEECQVCPAIPENPYDPKFDQIIQAIYTCGAILLVLYFFYCIYRMIIKTTGGQ